jgi:DNA-binding NarL/FixJ family response regulator
LLERQPLLAVVGEADDADELLALAAGVAPDIVLIDWDLAGATDGLISRLLGVCGCVRVVVLSGRPEARQAAMKAGADVFVSKTDPPECLLKAVEQAGKTNPLRIACQNEPA